MALVVPAHRIQTIHGVFGSPSWSSILPASGAAHSHELSFNSLPNTSLASVRSRGGASNLSTLLSARTVIPSTTPSTHTPVVTRPRRSSIHGASSPVSSRRAPPPPPVQRTAVQSSQAVDDPFADKHVETFSPPPRAPSSHARLTHSAYMRTQLVSSSTASSYAYPTVAAQRAQRDDQRTAKLVASVLLSRASGKPMRRRLPSIGEKEYVKSGLSQMVMLEC